LHAADTAYPPRGIGRPGRQGAPGDDCARLCDVILDGGIAAGRDHPRVRLRPQSFAERRSNPAARLWIADDLAAPFEWLSIRIGGLTAGSSAGDATASKGIIGGFVLGTTLGLVWTPCAGPVLGSILTVVATSKDTAWASMLLVTYAIGAAIPMLAIAYGGQAVTTRVRSFARIAPRLQQGFGVVVIGFAALSWLQYDTLIVAWLTHFYPSGQIGL